MLFIKTKFYRCAVVTHSIHSTYVSSDLLAPPRNDKLRAYILKILEELQASSANTRIGLTLSDVYFTWSWTNANISVEFQHNIVSECTENPRNTSSETMRLPDDSVIIHRVYSSIVWVLASSQTESFWVPMFTWSAYLISSTQWTRHRVIHGK